MSDEEFDISDLNSTFDFKGFIFKIFSYWKLFLISIAIGLGIAYYINVRKLDVFRASNLISIQDNQNPFFTTNTSLTFNWGGTTDKVTNVMIALRTLKHNIDVVEALQFYIEYQKEGDYQREDVYGLTPFEIKADTSAYQLYNHEMLIQTKTDSTFHLATTFPEEDPIQLYHYGNQSDTLINLDRTTFERDFKFGEPLSLPFFKGTVLRTPQALQADTAFYVTLTSLDGTASKYTSIQVGPESAGSSVLKLSLSGTNKHRLVDYLNATAEVLSADLLERKNQFATNTIAFIEERLKEQSSSLKDVETELNSFRIRNAIVDIGSESSELSSKIAELDRRLDVIKRQIDYLQVLEGYLRTRTDYTSVPAPSVAGINEPSIVALVSKIVSLGEQRSQYQYAYKENNPIFADIDRQINAAKSVLFENIRSSSQLLQKEKSRAEIELNTYEAEISRLPKQQQDLLRIQRRYNLNEESYNLFLVKLNEARLVKAANVGDLTLVDKAKLSRVEKIGPNTRLNYVLALLFGALVPLVVVFLITFFDNTIHTTDDLQKLSPIPILGVIGKSKLESNLVVIDEPRSAISESFRALRSSLQFMYRRQGVKGAKTVLITSSIGSEGKTFCSMNLASVFALSERKTVLIGLDFRKPKIFNDFDIKNDLGVVNYLIEQNTLEDIVQHTRIPHLDVITSGPIPPNPSELLMKERMDDFMEELKNSYDYIILDSPPIGLVADALALDKYVDATIYIVRQGFTKKGMLHTINEKYKTGEMSSLSFVLNYFEQKLKYGYSYGYGYNGYGQAYHEDVKTPWYKGWFTKKRS